MNIIPTENRRIAPLSGLATVLVLSLFFALPAAAQDNGDKTPQTSEGAASDADSEGSEGAEGDGEGDAEAAAEKGDEAAPSLRRGNRMEFDARLIRGEGAGSGAVFLFQRAQRPLPSMIEKRSSFLRNTVDTLLGESWAEKFDAAQRQNAQTD